MQLLLELYITALITGCICLYLSLSLSPSLPILMAIFQVNLGCQYQNVEPFWILM